MQTLRAHHSILVLCVLAFIFNLHYALPAYMQSSFLAEWVDDSQVGIIYAAGSLLMIIAFAFIAPVLSRMGNFHTTIWLLFIEFISLLGLAYAPSYWFVISFFVVSFVSAGLIWFSFDVFLEHFSKDSVTGNIRGIYLTIGNLAWVIGPSAAGFILGNGDYSKVFIVSASLLIPLTFLLKHNMSHFKDPEYKRTLFFHSFKELWKEFDVKNIFCAGLLLNFFYACMVIYAPLYLHQNIGFEWTTIGIIMSIVLLPFVIVDIPLGWLADKRFGEKEILTAGFLVMAISTMAIFLIDSKNVVIWTAILLATRFGAASVEIMIDTYFFKKVNSARINIISLFRSARPIAYVIAPLAATVLIAFTGIRELFLALGFLMFYGLRYSLAIKDTK